MALVDTASAIPPNSHAVGQGWKCDTGYKRQGQQCNKIFIPPNAVISGQGWICKTGFKRVSNQCNKVSANAGKQDSQSKKSAAQLKSTNALEAFTLAADGDQEALKTLLSFANQGNAVAQMYVASIYLVGKGVLMDHNKAIYWVRKAAINNEPTGQHWLGISYCNGKLIRKDLRQCAKWVKKAYENGITDASKTWVKFELWKYE